MRVGSTEHVWAFIFALALPACSGNEALPRLNGTGRTGVGGRDITTGGTDPTGSATTTTTTGGTGGSVGTGGSGPGTGGAGPSIPDATTGTDPAQVACRAKVVTDARCAS